MDTILLINDSKTLTKVLSSHFRKAGFQVIAVTAAMDAYEAFIKHECHLILTDYVLSDKTNGLEVIETFRSRKGQADLPIVVFTAMGDEDVAERCKTAGANLVLSKSASTQEILKKIETLVEEYKARLPTSSIDTDMGLCIVKSTVEVFKTMMSMKIVAGDIVVEKVQPRKAEVIGSIGVAGFLSGSISVFLGNDLARTASCKLLMMEDPSEVGEEDLVDAIGELTNMIGGSIKTELFQKTPLFDISIPSVYVGADLTRRTISNDLCFLVPFEYEGAPFSVEFLMITADSKETTGVQATMMESMNATASES